MNYVYNILIRKLAKGQLIYVKVEAKSSHMLYVLRKSYIPRTCSSAIIFP